MRECFVYLLRETKEISRQMFAELQQSLQESPRTWLDDLSLFAPLPALRAAAEGAKAPGQQSKYAGSLAALRNRETFPKAYLDPEVLFCLPPICLYIRNQRPK